MNEIWKDIKDYEGIYQVSNTGFIRSVDRYITYNDGRVEYRKGRILKSGKSIYGYARVILSKNNSKKYVSVHSVVAKTFIPIPAHKQEEMRLQINHIDEDKTNNCVDNLEWVTPKENINHGTAPQRRIFTQRQCQPRKKRVYQYSKDGTLIGRYISIRDAARHNNIRRDGIAHCCNHHKRFPTYKGYVWSFERLKLKGDTNNGNERNDI